MRNLWKDLGHVEGVLSILLLLGAIFVIAMPWQVSWFTPFWSRITGIAIIFILLLRSAYKVWSSADDQRERLQAEKDSKESCVELTNFHDELQYRIMTRGSKAVIAIGLSGILRNTSLQNSGSLDYFGLTIQTTKGFFRAETDSPPLGHKFEPNSIYPHTHFVFVGELSEPYLNIQSWEPYIKGAQGTVTLDVQGQKIRSYPIRVAEWNSGKQGGN